MSGAAICYYRDQSTRQTQTQLKNLTFNLHLSLAKAISLWPDREAVIDGDRRFTYKQFGERIGRLATYLISLGLNQNSIVGILAPNCHEYMETYYACAVAGVILNPINFRLSATEISGILEDSDATCFIVHQDFAANARSILAKTSRIKHVITIRKLFRSAQIDTCNDADSAFKNCQFDLPKTNLNVTDFEDALDSIVDATIPYAEFESDHLAQLYYTSGTTGKAKGVMLNHQNVTSNALGAVTELKLSDATTWGHFAPIFHLADAWAIFAVTWVGGKHVYVPYFKAEDVLNAINKEKVTITALVPTMANQLLAFPELKNYDLDSLQMLMTAGSPIAPEQVKRIMHTFDCDYMQFYGLTETSPFLTVGTIKHHLKNLPAEKLLELKSRTGLPFIITNVKVVDDKGKEIKWNNEEVGEIVARGPNVTTGYWKQPETTAQAIRNGWFHTGDLAVVDSEGYINIVDRSKDMIISGGENVYSTEVEYCLYEHSAVLECAVFGIPDDKWGELVKAVVVLKDAQQTSAEELIAHVKSRLAGYKSPRSLDIVNELPKTGSGKIFKKGLRDKYWQEGGRRVN